MDLRSASDRARALELVRECDIFVQGFRCPQEMLRDIFRFLGVGSDFSPDTSRHHLESHVPRIAALRRLKRLGIWQTAAQVTPSRLRPLIRRALTRDSGASCMEPADRNYLIDFYREDITNLSALLNRDLRHWLQPREQASHHK